jgi:3-phenylpropionate/trans-cinnamate dioxygenase ferredoxin subunit
MTELTYFSIVQADEIPNGERLFFEINGMPIVLFNIAGGFFAIGDVCTHDEGPLGDGDLDGYQVICPRHGAMFDVRTGEATHLPAVRPTPSYPVRVIDGMIEIGLDL